MLFLAITRRPPYSGSPWPPRLPGGPQRSLRDRRRPPPPRRWTSRMVHRKFLMETVNVRCIRCGDPQAARQLAELRQQLTLQADIVSPRGRQLTQAVFGETLPPGRVVERVCADVRDRGLEALLHYTEQLDGVRLERATLRVGCQELREA